MLLALPAHWRATGGSARLYLSGKFTAQAGQNALFAALVLAAGSSGNPGLGLSGFFVAMLIPALLLGPGGGALVDRLGAGRAYVLGAGLRATAPLAALPLMGFDSWPWVVAALYSAGSQLFTPAELALLHEVRDGRAGRTYSGVTVAQYAGQFAGAGIVAPIAFFTIGYPAVILAAVALFVLTAFIGRAMRDRGIGQAPTAMAGRRTLDLRPAGRFLLADRRASYAIVAITLSAVLTRTMVVAMPAYWRTEVEINQAAIAVLFAPLVAGAVTGLFWAYRGLDLRKGITATRWGAAGLIVACLSFAIVDVGMTFAAQRSGMNAVRTADDALNTTLVAMIPALFLVGVCAAVVTVSARMVLSELAPAGQQGRVHSLQLAFTEAVIIVPVLLAGVLTASVGARLTLAITGCLALGIIALMERRKISAPIPLPAVSATDSSQARAG